MTVHTSSPSSTLQVSVREARMAIDRILMTCGLPKGYVPAVRECILLSQSLGLAGFEGLRDHHAELTSAPIKRMAAKEEQGSALTFDAGHLHAWLVMPTVMDLAIDLARRHSQGTVHVINARHPDEFELLCALSTRYGAVTSVALNPQGVRVDVRNGVQPRDIASWDPLLKTALRDGYLFDTSRWREIYALSNKALAPDSVTSRRHAGPVVVDTSGRIVGRTPVDDETDLETLTRVC